jgi:hypothetical protein
LLLTSTPQSISGEVVENKGRKSFFGYRGVRQIFFSQGEYSQGGFLVGRKSTAQKRMEGMRERNRARQASYYARQREAGKKQWKVWVSPAQEKIFRAVTVLVSSEEGLEIAREVLLETVKRLRKN